MRSRVKRAFVIGALAVLTAWVCVQAVQAKDYPGPYDSFAGQYYEQEARAYQRWLNPNGSMSVAPSPSIYVPGTYAPAYPYSAASSTEGYYAPATSEYGYGAFASQQTDRANIRVNLPRADAKLWFSDSPTEQTGQTRRFVSPKLEPNKDYAYDVKVQWEENGKLVTHTRHVNVRANSTVSVDFTR